MTNWLSEIEENLKSQPIPNPRMDRMARVLREMAKRNKEAQDICNGTPEESEPRVLDDAITEILGVLGDNLSSDAKELLK